MKKKYPLSEISIRREELDKCVNCGLCQAVCPTFLVSGHEGLTARGKIVILKDLLDGRLKLSSNIADLFDDCLTCYACQTVCPALVRTDRLWTAARQDLAPWSTTRFSKRTAFRWSIGKPFLFRFVVRIVGLLFGFDRHNHQVFNVKHPKVTLFRGAPYLDVLKTEYLPESQPIGTVGLLVGCSCNLVAPWILDATIRLLTASGWRVIIPHDQVCCGAPAINNGDWKTARRLAKHNIRIFKSIEADYITSPDATCAGSFKRDYPELYCGSGKLFEEAERLAEKTVELSHLIAGAIDEKRLKLKPSPLSVTLHDSCHATHNAEGSRWRDILRKVDKLEIIEMQDSEHCCGFGGSYAYYHSDTSSKIADRKIERARKTRAKTILVGSPGCLLKLQPFVLDKFGSEINVKHVVELLAEALD